VKARYRIDCTPEIEAWRKANPIRKWLDSVPPLKRRRLKQLREKLGLGRESIYRYMHGQNLPTPERFMSLLAIIRCSVTTYMDWWKSMPK
jgi:predicted DNA-binding transcriptional regulator AlpA